MTVLDLKGTYNLIHIKEGYKWMTAFRTKFGLFEFLIMPFRLTNTPVTFQRMINQVLNEYLDRFIVVYLDDILIFLDILDKHIKYIYKVLARLEEANLLIEPKKYIFYI